MQSDNAHKAVSNPGIFTYRVNFTRLQFGNWRKYYESLAVNYFSKLFLLLFMDFYPSLKH